MKACVVIPCFNNQTTIGAVVKGCFEYINDVVVVDDGSTDASATYARTAGAEVAKLEENQGVGNALRHGIQYALTRGFTEIVTLDGDGAHASSDIPAMLATHRKNGNSLTIGNRWADAGDEYLPSMKLWANEFAAYILNSAAKLELPDVACGFRVLSGSLLRNLPSSNGFSFLYDMIFLARSQGTIGDTPIQVRYDANTLWITRSLELLSLLQSCHEGASESSVKNKLAQIMDSVRNWETLRLRLKYGSGSSAILVAHPLSETGGYLFQKQHPEFFESSLLDLMEI